MMKKDKLCLFTHQIHAIMKNLLIFLAILFLFSLSACEKEKSFEEKYVGAWDLTFDGSYSGEKTVIVKSDGSFSFEVVLIESFFDNLVNTLSGKILEDGTVEGDVFMSGDDIGDFIGTLEDNSLGEGTYATDVPTSGTWVAVKQ